MKSLRILCIILMSALAISGCGKDIKVKDLASETSPVSEETGAETSAPDAPKAPAVPEKSGDTPAPLKANGDIPVPTAQTLTKFVDELPEGYTCPKPIPPEQEIILERTAVPMAVDESLADGGGQMLRKAKGIETAAAFDGGNMNEADFEALKNFNTEEFSDYDPNRFQNVMASPLSTFGADVDTASYSIFRRKVKDNGTLKGLGLRAEEMINYFKYDYPEPNPGEPFSVTAEIADSPWNSKTKLMQIGFQTHKLTDDEMPPSNIVFLLDTSGSMYARDRLPLLRDSLLNMLPEMFFRDRISIVSYASDQRLVLDGASAKYCRSEIKKALSSLTFGGFTAGGKGIQMAYEVAQKHFIKGGNNRVILGTDGDLNVGISSVNELKSFIEKKRDSGIFLTVLGFGMGNLKDSKMEALADYGNGSYHYIDSIQEARRVLVDERSQTLFVAAKDVKFQVEFNPAKIKGYRLIGYETRKLAAEDFADDKKDGGEVGAGHQVTVLYELVEAGADVDVPEIKTKYQQPTVKPSDEWLMVNVRYKAPDGDKSTLLSYPVGAANVHQNMSENMRFAAAVAETNMLVNDSAFKGTSSIDGIIGLLSGLKSVQNDPMKSEFLSLVKDMKLQ